MKNLAGNGHPKGLYLLFCVEMWERFSFYGMRALIVLYMINVLSFSTEKAGNIYGLYTGLVYLTPLIGGYLADRFIGQRKCITAGAIFMCSGLFLLASGIHKLFFIALFLMICANGFFKSNISSVLGLLYGNDNEKKDSGYTIFYMGINLGAFLSPLVCGTLAVKYGFECGFMAAGVGMLLGLILYKSLENNLLSDFGLKPARKIEVKSDEKTDLKNDELQKLVALVVLMLFTIPFWISFEQAGSSLTLFAEFATNRSFFGHEIPTGYFQSLNPLFIITLAPLMSILWSKLRLISKEPTSVEKFTIALGLIALSYVILSFAGYFSLQNLVSPMWLVAGYFVMTVAELCLSPIGLSLVSKLAPRQFLSLMMGTWFLTSFFGNMIAGFWGGKYHSINTVVLFVMLANITLASCIILNYLTPKLNKILKH